MAHLIESTLVNKSRKRDVLGTQW